MADNILHFPNDRGIRQPIAQFMRLGDSGHRKLAAIHAAGRLPAARVVVDASRLRHQKELVDAFQASGAEIVLDTKVAELSAAQKFSGYAQGAPWSAITDGKLLSPDFFDVHHASDIYGAIARFAVQNNINVVLSPTHFLGDRHFDGWLDIDVAGCLALRKALDDEGGRGIAIDYNLILPHTWLLDADKRGLIMDSLADLPFDNLWVRASGFFPDAGGLAQRNYINAFMRLHNLGKPVVLDYMDGLVGLATVAFGASAGLAHGIGERGRFDARSWHKLPASRDDGEGFGRTTRITIPHLDRSLKVSELRVLAAARGAKRLITCNDRRCCLNGLDDMITNHQQHTAYQSMRLVNDLSAQPDLNRAAHFLEGPMGDCLSLARRLIKLKPPAALAEQHKIDVGSMMKRLEKHYEDKSKIYQALERLLEDLGGENSRSKPVQRSGKAAKQERQT